MLYKHECSPVLQCVSQTSRNNVEKVMLDVGSISSSPPSLKSSDIGVLPCKLIELKIPFFVNGVWLSSTCKVKRDLFNVITYYAKRAS